MLRGFHVRTEDDNPSETSKEAIGKLQDLCVIVLTRPDIIEKHAARTSKNCLFPPFLLKRVIAHNYSKYYAAWREKTHNFKDDVPWVSPNCIASLVNFWPFECLTLREQLNKILFDSLFEQMKYRDFLNGLVKLILHTLLTECNEDRVLRRLDISGIEVIDSLPKLLDQFSSSTACQPVEVVCDLSFQPADVHYHDQYQSSKKNIPAIRIVHVNKITFSTLGSDFIFKHLEANKHENFQIMEFRYSTLSPRYIEEYCTRLSESLQGLGLCYCKTGVDEFRFGFLKQLKHLQQLDVSGIVSQGQFSVLADLPTGLIYLDMAECKLQPEDFLGLERHADSLLQLDLSKNSFNSPNIFILLSKFLCKLKNITDLHLGCCRLQLVPETEFIQFLSRFKTSCQRLKLLNLMGNRFSWEFTTDTSCLLSLIEIPSLKLMYLPLPDYIRPCDDRDTGAPSRYRYLKKNVNDKIRRTPSSQVKVVWDEAY